MWVDQRAGCSCCVLTVFGVYRDGYCWLTREFGLLTEHWHVFLVQGSDDGLKTWTLTVKDCGQPRAEEADCRLKVGRVRVRYTPPLRWTLRRLTLATLHRHKHNFFLRRPHVEWECRWSHNIKVDDSSFERVEEFKYLVTLTNQNSIQEEIKSR
jgi:hypothetical protein